MDSDKSTIVSMVKKISTTKKVKDGVKEEKEIKKRITKHKRPVDRDQKSKIVEAEEDDCLTAKTSKNLINSGDRELEPSELQSLIEAQTKELWVLKDDLEKNLSTKELHKMLEANNQDSSGLKLDLRDRCADMMLFGALENCPLCSGHLHYSGGTYKCKGFLTNRPSVHTPVPSLVV